MAQTMKLLRGDISLEDALTADVYVTPTLSYRQKRFDLWCHFYMYRTEITETVCRHLNLAPKDVDLGDVKEWLHGSFNACIPASVKEDVLCRRPGLPRKVMIRFPLPYKVGEEFYPGNAEEKLRCEAATYMWLRENCPSIPIPRLLAIGLPGGRSFTAIENESLVRRVIWWLRSKVKSAFGQRLPPYYIHKRPHLLDIGYLLIEYVENGEMLSESWEEHRSDSDRRTNLYRDLSRIMLSLAKIPQPRIGSWTMDDQGNITLTNRPLTWALQHQENENFPSGISRSTLYHSTEPYYFDLLSFHDNALRHQPNAIHSESDGRDQLAEMTGMRTLLPHFTDRQLRETFAVFLTDLHTSNVFVDQDWHITKIIDLEWACSRPIEMLQPPRWLTGISVNSVYEYYREYKRTGHDFINIFEAEERKLDGSSSCTDILRSSLDTGRAFYTAALDDYSLLSPWFSTIINRLAIVNDMATDEVTRVFSGHWGLGVDKFLAGKLEQQAQYEEEIKTIFAEAARKAAEEAEDEKETAGEADETVREAATDDDTVREPAADEVHKPRRESTRVGGEEAREEGKEESLKSIDNDHEADAETGNEPGNSVESGSASVS